jgi:ubiquinone/menaquinone biosynthesis C-methylase UbiE
MIDPEMQLADIENMTVLCLAASGGQQSAAFGLLGARVTVCDLSENQLEKDRLAADHYGFPVETVQGDMQDLSGFAFDSFDIVWLAHSINFVPDARTVIRQVSRILKNHGKARLNFTNPYVHGAWDNPKDDGFIISSYYKDGAEVENADPLWQFTDPEGKLHRVRGPKEFRHYLSTIINTTIKSGLRILGLWEEVGAEQNPKHGSWEHFMRVAPPWLTIWGEKRA